MDIQNFSKYGQIQLQLTGANTDTVTTVFEPELPIEFEFLRQNGYALIINNFVKNYRILVGVKSIAEITLPQFEVLSSREEKNKAISRIEWTSQRIHLNLLSKKNISTPWLLRGTMSLTNRGAMPNYQVDAMAYHTESLAIDMGEDGRLAVQLENVNYGLLKSDDYINICGSFVTDVVAIPKPKIQITQSIPGNAVVGTESTPVLLPNQDRKYFVITNKSQGNIFLNLGSTAIFEGGIYLPPGGIFEYTNDNTEYLGVITAIADRADCLLPTLVCV